MDNNLKTCRMIVQELHAELSKMSSIHNSLSQCTPDMVWIKDPEGTYIYCNDQLAWGLYSTTVDDVIGNNDINLAKNCKNKQTKFTFGEMCANSDEVILRTQIPTQFLESGYIRGNKVSLMVNKALAKTVNGDVIGTVGIGRDVTYYFDTLTRIAKETTDPKTKEDLNKLINYHFFENKDN